MHYWASQLFPSCEYLGEGVWTKQGGPWPTPRFVHTLGEALMEINDIVTNISCEKTQGVFQSLGINHAWHIGNSHFIFFFAQFRQVCPSVAF